MRNPGRERLLTWALALCALFVVACGGHGETRPGMLSDGGSLGGQGNSTEGGAADPCEEGATRECSVTIDQANGVTSCWHGTQTCVDGVWDICLTDQDRQTSRVQPGSLDQRLPTQVMGILPSGPTAAALSTAVAVPCSGNVCDPSCLSYTETPNLTATGGSGGPPPAPPDFTAPPTSVCAHNLCDAGAALDSTCHPCVATVCAASPSCCTTAWTASCASAALLACPASPTPLIKTPSNCSGVATYADGTYGSGANVQSGGHLYTCTSNAYSAYCGNSGYRPGTANGTLPWIDQGVCTTAATCAINTNLPAVPSYEMEPCKSGLDCQVNESCKDVATSGTCTHSKCTVGTALSKTCDSCVARVCAANAACCTDDGNNTTFEWSATCVGLVKTKCDADCGTSAGTACTHDACTVSATPLVSTCDSCVANVCATPGFGYCCTSAWDQFCVDETKRTCGRTTTTTTLGSGNNMCDYALMGAGAVALYGARVSGGDLGGGTGSNKISFSGSIPTQLGASVYSQGAMAIDSPSTVVGNAKAGGTLSGCSQVLGGTCTGATTVPNASVPTKTFTCPVMTAETFTADATLPSGAHGAITVNAGVKLTLQPGAYRVTSLTLLAGASLVMPSSGTVYFDSCGAVAFGAGATMTGFTSSAADAFRFQMYGNGNLTVGASAHLEGIFSFPTKSATLSAGADWSSGVTDIKGLVQASTVTMNQYTWIKADGIAGQNCLNNLIDQTLPGTCPMVVGSTAPPPGTGQCTHNDTGYKDPNVGSTAVDLALDMACGDNITVCNHGRADAPAGVQVGLYSRAGQQFAVEKPDENYRVGTCTVASTIAAGQCQTVACNPTLMSADLFAMVNPTGAVSEFSLLDNWTMHSTGSTCPATGSTKTYTYEYVATCPNDQSPLWGLLSWNTTTPGSSTVTFGARVAKTSAALSGSFTTLGVASAAGTDTQVCSKFSGDPGCPVDITGMLGLGKQQPSHLELQVVLDNIGSGATTAQSWDLNYTCVDDQ